jgi:hypothetical protein
MLTRTDLPEGLIGRCMDVMKEILLDEREFVRVIVEVIDEVKDEEHTDDVHWPVGWITQLYYLYESTHSRLFPSNQRTTKPSQTRLKQRYEGIEAGKIRNNARK